MAETKQELAEALSQEAERITRVEEEVSKAQALEQEAIDDFGDKIKLVPTPNFTNAASVGTSLPINMASEIVTNLSKYAQEFDLVEFVKDKLNYATRLKVTQCYASEQIDALVMAIKSFEQNNAFILGDMAGIGKGRICAGIMRYAYQMGLTPVFITHKAYLFSDFYRRDLMDVGGFGTKGKKIGVPVPFIMNTEPKEASIRDFDDNIIYSPLSPRKTNAICASGKLPSDYNCVFLTYSQISQASQVRRGFLEEIAPKSIFVFDESHNSASADENSMIMRAAIPLVTKANAVLFSSATYAKNPEVFGLYVIRTALRTAVPSLSTITDALKVGGENVSEYIATGLCKEGQMIRRERSFGDCRKVTEYLGMKREPSGYIKMTDYDEQAKIYNEAISYFKELRDFSKTDLAKNGIYNAVIRSCLQMGYSPVPFGAYESAMASNNPTDKQVFINAYIDKWVVKYKKDSIARYKTTFRENLFLALKADFTAKQVIECLNTPVEYTNNDGTKHTAPMKPLIAIKSTGEALFRELDLQDGQQLNNDFSEYLQAIYNKLFGGDFELRKVDQYVFESESELIDKGIITQSNRKNFFQTGEYTVVLSDYADGGAMISDIQKRLMGYKSKLPFSTIDYIREKIQSTSRASIYYSDFAKTVPRFGNAIDPNYIMTEATGRNNMLAYSNDTKKWVYTKINKTSTTSKFLMFNNGSVDVMLLNVTASTGGSAQSSPKEGKDTRPRNMFIAQFEPDINVEVQKRGRVNRTGQLNSPTYTYLITKIPVEMRTYLMFRKKLRKLDANTSANQAASEDTADIPDSSGNKIEDIFNQYGFEAFSSDFLADPKNLAYKKVFDDLRSESWSRRSKGSKMEQIELHIEEFNRFVRELELYPVDFQEGFFDQMNVKYADLVNTKKALKEYQLELEVRQYKAAIKQSVPIQLNSGTTIFSLPLSATDYYTLETRKPLRKDKVMQKISEYCTLPDGRTLSPEQFNDHLKRDFNAKFDDFLYEHMQSFEDLYKPKKDDFPNQEDYDIEQSRYLARYASEEETQKGMRDETYRFIRFFVPKTPVYYWGCYGYFVGYRFLDNKTKFKYTRGNIEFNFCFLNKFPTLKLKLSNPQQAVKLQTIMDSTVQLFGSPFRDEALMIVENWKADMNRRVVRRFLTGNILGGIMVANTMKNRNEIVNWSLERFTNYDGSYTTAVELAYETDLPNNVKMNQNTTALSVSSGNTNFLKYAEQIPLSLYDDYVPYWNIANLKVISGLDGERGICFLKKRPNTLHVQIVQPYKEDKDTGDIIDITDPKSARYNFVFHDNKLTSSFKKYLQSGSGIPKKIKYGILARAREKDGKGYLQNILINYGVYIKDFAFDLSNVEAKDDAKRMCNHLSSKYDLSINFRASDEAALIVDERADISPEDLKKEVKRKDQFEQGSYEYIFTRKTPESVIKSIPNLETITDAGTYGGVVLNLPMMPNMLPSYNLIPFRIPNEVMVKLALSQLSDLDKGIFLSELERKSDETPLEIGLYVNEFLNDKTLSTDYIFGKMRTPDYGQIFKNYVQNKDVEGLVFAEAKEKQKPTKSKVTFEDAEDFLITMITS